MFLATHPFAGRALFTKTDDARDWLNHQNRSYYDDADLTTWVEDTAHGWAHPVLPNKAIYRTPEHGMDAAGTVHRLIPDEHAPKDLGDDWD